MATSSCLEVAIDSMHPDLEMHTDRTNVCLVCPRRWSPGQSLVPRLVDLTQTIDTVKT